VATRQKPAPKGETRRTAACEYLRDVDGHFREG
jgi:hypothetical protein